LWSDEVDSGVSKEPEIVLGRGNIIS